MPGPWKLEPPQAVLTADSFGAVLTVARPQQGLQSLRPFFERQEDVRLFQIRIGDGEQSHLPVADAYTRLHDLIVSYAESAPSACGSQIYWRFLDGSRHEDLLAGIDLIISAQTTLLDAQPEITTSSRIAAAQILRLSAADSGEFQPIDVGRTAERFEPASGPGCFLFRPAAADFSYVEMIHPTDFSRSQLHRPEGQQDLADLQHVVISRWMEKGVIVRARIRGAFVGRTDDSEAAAGVYRDFCTAKIPLTV